MANAAGVSSAQPYIPQPAAPPAPPKPTLLFMPQIRGLLEEAKALTPDDYRRIVVTMRVALSTSDTADNNTYRVSGVHKMLIDHVDGHLVLQTPLLDQAIGIQNFTTNFQDVRFWKASNCRLTLVNNDDNTNIVGENQAASLEAILRQPLDWRGNPHIVPPGATLLMSATLITTAQPYVGNSTEYGVKLGCTLVRVAAS